MRNRQPAAAAFDGLEDVFARPDKTAAAPEAPPASTTDASSSGRAPAPAKRPRAAASAAVSSSGRAAPGAARALPTISLPEAPARAREEEDYITTTFRYPRYVNRMMDEYLVDHPHHSKTSLFLNAMKLMGFDVDDADLLPRRGSGRR